MATREPPREVEQRAGKRPAPSTAPRRSAQASPAVAIQRKDGDEASPGGSVLTDGTPLAGQMSRDEFMTKLSAALLAATDEELASVGQTSKDCPYLLNWLGFYRARPATQVERAAIVYTGTRPSSGEAMINAVVARSRRAIRAWKDQQASAALVASAEATQAPDDTGVQAKALAPSSSGPAAPPPPAAIQASLGPGRDLDSGFRSRAEIFLGRDLGAVRIHDDTRAAGLAMGLSARAFTVGHDVAFGPGEYRPGTVVGDALIAHELAHTLQQSDGSVTAASGGSIDDSPTLEREADRTAVGMLFGATGSFLEGSTRALGLQRCKKEPPPPGLEQRIKDLDAVIAKAKTTSFGEVAQAITVRADLEQELLISKRGYGSLVGTEAPPAAPGAYPAGAPEKSDCTIFTRSVLKDAFTAQGRAADWQKVAKKWSDLDGQSKGTTLQQALESELGWKGVFWSPDPTHDPESEHPVAYKQVKAKGEYYGVTVEKDKSVVGYRLAGPDMSDPTKLKKVETEELKKLRKVHFGILSARGGRHMAVFVGGKIYEVHWDQPASSPRLIDATDLTDWAWRSGAIVMPPEEMTEAWK